MKKPIIDQNRTRSTPPPPKAQTPPPEAGDFDPNPNGFPLDGFPETQRDLILAGAVKHRLPVETFAVPCIGAVSCIIGDYVLCQFGEHVNAGNLYLLTIAPSGSGKTIAAKLMLGPLKRIEEWLRHSWNNVELPLRQAKVDQLEKSMKDGEPNKTDLAELARLKRLTRKPNTNIGDTNGPTFIDRIRHGSLWIASADAGDLIEKWSGSTGSNDGFTTYLSMAYSRDETVLTRKTEGYEAYSAEPCAAMVLAVQPKVYRELKKKNPKLTSVGLFCRFRMISVDANHGKKPEAPIPQHLKDRHRDLIIDLASLRGLHVSDEEDESGMRNVDFEEEPRRRMIRLSPEGETLLCEFDGQCQLRANTDLCEMADTVRRSSESAHHFAIAMHAMRYGSGVEDAPISAETVKAAISLERWFLKELAEDSEVERTDLRKETENRMLDRLRKSGDEMSLRSLYRSEHVSSEEARFIIGKSATMRIERIGRIEVVKLAA